MHLTARKLNPLSVILISLLIINVLAAVIGFSEGKLADVKQENGEDELENQEQGKINVNWDIHTDSSVFQGGETFYVSGKLDLFGHEQTIGAGAFPLPLYIPAQTIVIQVNNSNTWVDLPGATGITSGVDSNVNGIDDRYGVEQENFTSWTEPGAGNFNITVVMPERVDWPTFGLISGENQIRSYYGSDTVNSQPAGNSTIPIEDEWAVEIIDIMLSESATIEATAFTTDPDPIAQTESTSINFTTKYESSPTIIPNVNLEIEFFYDDTGTWQSTTQAAMGMTFVLSTGNNQTGSDGVLNLTIYTTVSTPEDDYLINVTAIYTQPPFSLDPYYFQKNATVNATFTVLNPINTAEIIFDSGNASEDTVRPGEDNKTFILHTRANFVNNATQGDLSNILINYQLYNYTGTQYVPISPGAANTNVYADTNRTDGSGLITFHFNSWHNPSNLNTQTLMLRITANFSETTSLKLPLNFIVTNTSYYDYNLTLDQIWDRASFESKIFYPSGGDRPLTNTSWAILECLVRIRNMTETGTVYYYLNNVPVNATLNGSYLGIGIQPHTDWVGSESGLLPGYYHTNSTGYVLFNISSIFPDRYIPQVIEVDLTAKFTDGTNIKFRFIRNDEVTNKTLKDTVGPYSIDPDYSIGRVELFDHNATSSSPISIKPGKALNLTYFVYYDNQGTDIPLNNIPINFTYELEPGISYQIDISNGVARSGYWYTKNGYFSIIFTTQFGIIAEEITFNVTITADFENDSSSDYSTAFPAPIDHSYLIGEQNAGQSTWNDYNTTWTEIDMSFDVDIQYEKAIIECLNGTTIDIRPGEWTEITFLARMDNVTQTPLANVPVNVSLNGVYPGVSLSLVNNSNYQAYTGYVRTNANGHISYRVTTTMYDGSNTYPKNFLIYVNATANYTNYGATYHSNPYLVGIEKIGIFNLSQKSFDTLRLSAELAEISVDPNYYTGIITFVQFNETRVQQEQAFSVLFNVTFDPTSQAVIDDNLEGVPIGGVTVRLNTTFLENWNINSTEANQTITRADGGALFNLSTTASTPEVFITIGAYVIFNDTKVLNSEIDYTIPGSPGFEDLWINGTTDNFGGDINTTYSSTNSSTLRVLNAANIDANIIKTYSEASTVHLTSGPWSTMRGYIVTIQARYKNSYPNTDPKVGEDLSIYLNVTSINDFRDMTAGILASSGNITTDNDGYITVNMTIPTDIRVEDIHIIVDDDMRTDEQNATILLPIKTNLLLNLDPLLPQNDQEFLQNDNSVTLTGTVTDKSGDLITTGNFNTSIINEANNTLYLRAYYINDNIITGLSTTISIDENSEFSHVFTIPSAYVNATIRFQVLTNATDHFYANNTLRDIITTRTQKVYQNISYSNLIIYYPNGSSFDLSSLNETIYTVTGYSPDGERKNNDNYFFSFTLMDNYGRILPNMDVSYNQNGSVSTITSDVNGIIRVLNFSIITANANINHTYYFTFEHDSINATYFDSKYFTLNWYVKDIKEPTITLENENEITTREYYEQVINFTLTIDDTAGIYIYSGIDDLTVQVHLNDVWYENITGWTTSISFEYQLDVTAAGLSHLDTINFTVSDKVGNVNTVQFILKLDTEAPVIVEWTILDNITKGSDVFVNGTVTINVNVTDANIDTTATLVAIQSSDIGDAVDMFYSDPYFYYEVDTTAITANLDLEFTVWVYDLGNRETTVTVLGSFTIDNDNPVLDVDTNSVASWNAQVVTPTDPVITADLTINDGAGSGFLNDDVNASTRVYVDDQLLSSSEYTTLSGIAGQQDGYTFSWDITSSYQSLSTSNEYTIYFTTRDALGHETNSSTLTFKLDIYKPEITIGYSFIAEGQIFVGQHTSYGTISQRDQITTQYSNAYGTGDFVGEITLTINITDSNAAVTSGLVNSSIYISITSNKQGSWTTTDGDFTIVYHSDTVSYTRKIYTGYNHPAGNDLQYEDFTMDVRASDNSFDPERESYYEFGSQTPQPPENWVLTIALAGILGAVGLIIGVGGAFIFERWYYE
ncbi:MAG: hypothetical protein ACXAEU_02150 [Candidatus Hodarchaeales archaeon]|jgi:hypothetical protein